MTKVLWPKASRRMKIRAKRSPACRQPEETKGSDPHQTQNRVPQEVLVRSLTARGTILYLFRVRAHHQGASPADRTSPKSAESLSRLKANRSVMCNAPDSSMSSAASGAVPLARTELRSRDLADETSVSRNAALSQESTTLGGNHGDIPVILQ